MFERKKIEFVFPRNKKELIQLIHNTHSLYSCFEILSVDFSLDSNFPPTFESIFRPFGRWALGQNFIKIIHNVKEEKREEKNQWPAL